MTAYKVGMVSYFGAREKEKLETVRNIFQESQAHLVLRSLVADFLYTNGLQVFIGRYFIVQPFYCRPTFGLGFLMKL